MSYIEKLLHGVEVEWRALEEVAIRISSGGTPNTGVSAYYDGDIPWLRTQEVGSGDIWDTGIKITELGLNDSSAKMIPENCVIVAMYGATVGKIGVNKIPLCTNQACANIQLNEEIAHYRYVYHFLLSRYEYIKSLGAGSQTNINAHIVRNLQIPIPPLSVQKEIVRILDKFTELTTELTTELATELTARKKQYSYYRETLLSFEEGEVEWKTLGEVIIKSYSGSTPQAGNPKYYEKGTIPWLRTQELKFSDIENTEIKITDFALKETAAKWIPINCVIIAISGATAGRSAINKIPLTTNQHCLCLEINSQKALYRYVFHWISFNYEKLKALGQGARGDLNSGIIKNYKIPVPSLEEQARIVSILDKFDILTTSIREVLPKEIELRKKQYEYYRDLLLTFPKNNIES